jgi:hypothetical protein
MYAYRGRSFCSAISPALALFTLGHVRPKPLVWTANPKRIFTDVDPLDSLDAVAQLSKIAERLNFHRFRSRRNSDHKDLVLVPFHPLMNVCKMNEVLFRDQGTFVSGFVVDGNRPSCAHRIFSPKSLDTPLQVRIESFCRPEGTRTIRPDESAPHQWNCGPLPSYTAGFRSRIGRYLI